MAFGDEPGGAHDLQRQVGRDLVVLAPVELGDRRRRPEVAVAQVLRQDAQTEQAHDLDPLVAPGQLLADQRFVDAPVRACERDQTVPLVPEHDRVERRLFAPLVAEQ